ncbi:response regulator [Novosphingobium sp. MW5]|nr:response regulator [Novosphingobium sp. MW5]
MTGKGPVFYENITQPSGFRWRTSTQLSWKTASRCKRFCVRFSSASKLHGCGFSIRSTTRSKQSLAEPPNVILTDWRMEPTSGYQFLRLVRHRHMEPLCFVPILFVTAHGTGPLVDKALRAGAHHVLVKPVSPSTLYKRLRWLLTDDRPMTLEHSGFYNIYGIHKTMDEQAGKMQSLAGARLYHRVATQKRAEVEDAVEAAFEKKAESGPVFAGVKKEEVKAQPRSAAARHIRNAGYATVKDVKLH